MVNVALDKPCQQSSTHANNETISSAAHGVDGNKDGNYHHNHCASTQQSQNPWWRVDLLDQYLVQWVEIANRQDDVRESFSTTALP